MSLARCLRHLVTVNRARRPFLGLLISIPIAVLSAQACGGNAVDDHGGIAGDDGLSGSRAGGSGSRAGSAGTGGSSGSTSHGVGGRSAAEAGNSGAAPGGGSAGGSVALDVRACTSNTECEVVPASCCSCGTAAPAADFTAINSAYAAQFNARCAAAVCAPCPPMAGPGLNDPSFYVVATCQRPAGAPANAPGHCAIVDLRATEITACKSASDCNLREGTACCERCLGQPVAVAGKQGSALRELVCNGVPSSCPACSPSFYGYQTVCDDGRCGVALTP